MLNAREENADMIPDQRLRRLQHLLIDLIDILVSTRQPQFDRLPRKCKPAIQCDCQGCNCAELEKQRLDRRRSYAVDAPTQK